MGAAMSIGESKVNAARLTEIEYETICGPLYISGIFDFFSNDDNEIEGKDLIKIYNSYSDVFLSHDWGKEQSNHKRVKRINDALESKGIKTWFDGNDMKSSIGHDMALGIDCSSCVIVFVTKNYVKKVNGNNASDNCQLEFSHAVRSKTNQKIIPIVMEEDMLDTKVWKGFFGMQMAGLLYFDMSSDDNFDSKITDLVEKIKYTISLSQRSLFKDVINPAFGRFENTIKTKKPNQVNAKSLQQKTVKPQVKQLAGKLPGIPDVGKSGKVAIKTWQNRFVCAEKGGNSTVIGNRDKAAGWETFTMHRISTNQVNIQTFSGHFLCAEGGGGSNVVANRVKAAGWETFDIIPQGSGNYAFRTCNKVNYLCAEQNGAIVANRTQALGWETFRVESINSISTQMQPLSFKSLLDVIPIGKPGKVTIKTWQNKFVCAEKGGNSTVVGNRDKAAGWETFTMHRINSNQVQIQTFSGHFLCAEGGGGSNLVANRVKAAGWETFNIIPQGSDNYAFRTCNKVNYLCAEQNGTIVANRTKVNAWERFKVQPI